jgi:hypothetical protein
VGADPDLRPGRRNHQGAEALQRFPRTDRLAIGTYVREATPYAVTANSRHRIGNVPEARGCRGPHVFTRHIRLTQLSSSDSHARWSRLMPRDGEAGRRIWTRRGLSGNLFLADLALERVYRHPRLRADPNLDRHATC